MSTHLGDEIELYALGDLSHEERAAVEAHLAVCMECTRSVGEAERTLAEFAELLPSYRAPRAARMQSSARWRGAIAAAFIAGLLVAGGTLAFVNRAWSGNATIGQQDVRAQIAMVNSHFDHTTLAPASPGAPPAKVIFARDKAWLYAIVNDNDPGYHLVAVSGDTRRDLGVLTVHGATASLFVQHPPSLSELALVNGDRVVARGMLR